MKKIVYGLILCLVMNVLASCEEDTTQDFSTYTYYASFQIKGEQFMLVPLGTKFVEPGVTAEIKGEDVTSKIEKKGRVDDTTPGIYYVTYSVANKEGFVSSVTRTVAVCDPTIETNMAGKYKSSKGSYRLYPDFEGTLNGSFIYEGKNYLKTDFNGYNVTVNYMAPGIFSVSDIMGGYYSQRAMTNYPNGYGSTYNMKGFFQLFADNHIECLSGDVAGWGDSFTSFKDGKYDPVTRTITYMVGYNSMMFFMTLNL